MAFTGVQLSGQDSTVVGMNKAQLQWDASHAKELTQREAIGVSKKLTDTEKEELTRYLMEYLRPQMKQLEINSENELRQTARESRVAMVDLDAAGSSEVIVQMSGENSGCGGTGNCPLLILEKTTNSYKTILRATAQTFVADEARSNGFRDVVLGLHGSATESELRVYHYRDGRYGKVACYEAAWQADLTGPTLKQPIITKCQK
jgi:hypothetical protein